MCSSSTSKLSPLTSCNRLQTVEVLSSYCYSTQSSKHTVLSRMNLVCDELRNTITVQHLSALMFVSLVGPCTTTYMETWAICTVLAGFRASDVMQQQLTVQAELIRRPLQTLPDSWLGTCCDCVMFHELFHLSLWYFHSEHTGSHMKQLARQYCWF